MAEEETHLKTKEIAKPTATEDSVLTVTKSVHIMQPVVPNQIGKRAQVREELSLLIQEAKTHQGRKVDLGDRNQWWK